jgi:hypothetical protein
MQLCVPCVVPHASELIPIYIFLKAVADTDAVIVQALIASVCGLIGSAIHPQFLPVRQVFESGKRVPMLGDCHAEGKAGMKKQRAAETGQRRGGRQTAIVDGAAEKRFEEQVSGKWQRQGDVWGLRRAGRLRTVVWR